MIFVALKLNGVLCRVAPHPVQPDRTNRSSLAQLELTPRFNDAIAKALRHGDERRRPNGGYGIKCLRGRIAKDCIGELKFARDRLVYDDDDGSVNFSAYSALNLLIWWADANPDAVFSVT